MRMASTILLLVIVSGCQDRSTMTPSDRQTTARASASPLALQLDAPTKAGANTAMPLKLTLSNAGTEPVQVMLGGRPPYDFVITSADGARSWRWSDGNAAQMILEARTLQPGDYIVYETGWLITDGGGNVPPPGRYRLRGILNMDPPETMETAPQDLAVIAR